MLRGSRVLATTHRRPSRQNWQSAQGTSGTMRSKGMPARALFRLVTSHTASAQTPQASSAAATAASSAASSSAAAPQQRQQRVQSPHASSSAPTRSFRRKQQLLGTGTASPSLSRSRRSLVAARPRHDGEAAQVMHSIKKMLYDADQSPSSRRRPHDTTPFSSFHGALSTPPPTSLGSVATQAFFAHDRPLLEYMVISGDAKDASSSQWQQLLSLGDDAHQDEANAAKTATEREEIAQVKQLLTSAHSAISEIVAQSKNMSQEELSRTTFVIAATEDEVPDAQTLESWQQQLEQGPESEGRETGAKSRWTRRLENVGFARFSSIVDRLTAPSSAAQDVIKAEVDAIAAEDEHRREVQSAVEEAMEYGEDPAAARALGREADLVILGEPKGAQPDWARGAARYLAQNTRAFEPPPAPTATAGNGAEKGGNKVAASHSTIRANSKVPTMTRRSNGMVLDMPDDDPNLLLSHAMVQARLPGALAWDRLVAKMDAATLGEGASESAASLVDVAKLNADALPARAIQDPSDDINVIVNLDSVKRKRRKKMRKHKYKKLRKATRTERSRLKK